MCLNFIEGGRCDINRGECLLGLRGATVKNADGECELHGKFDVWLTQENDLLITDMGFPSEEPKQCLALEVNESVARGVAFEKSKHLGTLVITSRRRCRRCGSAYWISQHKPSDGLHEPGHGDFCPECIGWVIDQEMEKRLSVQRYWCG